MLQTYEGPVLIEDVFYTKCSLAASLTFLLFDHILTWPTELKHVWKEQWSFAKVLYIATHYWGITILAVYAAIFFNSNVYATVCRHFIYLETPGSVIMILLVEVILIARLYAVYNRNKAILVFTSFLAVGATISTVTIALVGISRGSPAAITGCHIVPAAHTVFGFTLLPQMICEGCLCGLMVIQICSVYTFCGSRELLQLLIWDSVIYFYGIFGTLLVNTILWRSARETLGGIAIGWVISVPCVLGGRLLSNIRQRAACEETLFSQFEVPMTRLRFRPASPGPLA